MGVVINNIRVRGTDPASVAVALALEGAACRRWPATFAIIGALNIVTFVLTGCVLNAIGALAASWLVVDRGRRGADCFACARWVANGGAFSWEAA